MKKNTTLLLINLFSITITYSQAGMWTWMQGSNLQGQIGSYGVQGVASPTNGPPVTYEGCEWTDLSGNFWYYGGTVGASAMWKYDPTINMWTWVNGPSSFNNPAVYGIKGIPSPANNPGPKEYGALTWVDKQGDLWVFGGLETIGAPTSYCDLWKYNIASNMWTWMNGPGISNPPNSYGTKGIAAASNYPPGRTEGNACWVDNNGNLWLFGGQTSANVGYLNDLWKYDISTNDWTWIRGSNIPNFIGNYGTTGVASATNDPPAAAQTYSKWKDLNGNFWMFSLDFGSGARNQTWKYNVTTNQWTCIAAFIVCSPGIPCLSTATNAPAGRVEARTCWTDKCGNFWLFGGFYTNDLWCYKPLNNEWIFISGSNGTGSFGAIGVPAASNYPKTTIGAAPYTHNDGSLWFFGGQYNNAMWRYVIDTNCVGGCTLSQNPTANFSGTNLTGCSSLTVNFNNTSTNATSWNWSFGDENSSTAQNPSNTYTTPGQYTVTLTASNSTGTNTTTQTNYITVFPSPTATVSANVTITPGTTATLTASGGGTYNWYPTSGLSCTTCANPTATPTITTTYCVEVMNTSGCLDTACVKITVETPCATNENLQIPNAFSPNKDNVNDDFCLQGWDACIVDFEIFIYDRWGEKVFESKDPNFCWDGVYNGKVLDAQVFVFYVKAKYSYEDKAVIKKGNISLIR